MTRIASMIMAAAVTAAAEDAARIGATRGRVTPPGGSILSAGQHIRTGWNAFADLLFDPDHTIRMRGETEMDVVSVAPGDWRLTLIKGTIQFHVDQPSLSQVQVDTSNVSVAPSQPGLYEVSAKGNRSQVIAEDGSIAVFAAGGHQWVYAGQKMTVRGVASNPEFKIASALTVWKRLQLALGSIHTGGGSGGASIGASDAGSNDEPSTPAARPEPPKPSETRHTPPITPPAVKDAPATVRGKQ